MRVEFYGCYIGKIELDCALVPSVELFYMSRRSCWCTKTILWAELEENVSYANFYVMPETYTKIKTSIFFQMYTDFECRGLKNVHDILSVSE